jgi:hypothetical protein
MYSTRVSPARGHRGPGRGRARRRSVSRWYRALTPLVAVVLWGTPASTQESGQRTCLTSQITFHTGTLERLLAEPGAVLADEEGFWSSEPPQRFVRQWSEGTGVAIAYERWREEVRALAELSETDRRNHPFGRMAREVAAAGDAFLGSALPHICGFLPASSNLDIEVHFTAFVPPRSFVANEVVIDVSAEYWQGSVANILNNLVHEIFHVGYSKSRPGRTEAPLPDARLYEMLDALQNEGLATLVAYEARASFPAPGERDYPMLDDAGEVRRLRGLLNGLFALSGTASEAQLRQWAWRRGVTMRGYYVVGAHMGRTIDREMGRNALIETIREGPASFVRAYNALVSGSERLVVPGIASDE